MKTRIKMTGPVIRSRNEMETLAGEIATLQNEYKQASAELDGGITNLRKSFEGRLSALDRTIQEKCAAAQGWAEANPSEFRGLKSLELTHATIGWRTGNPTLKTISGWTWDRVLEKLVAAASNYVRSKQEVDKQALLADRDSLGDEKMRAIGIRVIQEELFYVEPKLSEVENRINVAA